MFNRKIALLGAAVAALASTGANAATQTATAEARIITAVTLTQNTGLNLGTIAPSAAAGTVTLPTGSNTRTCSASVTCVGTATRGQFTVAGAATGFTVGITVPTSTSLTGAGAPMGLTLVPSITGFTSTGAPVVFFVGGTLSVGANQVAGTYTGTYNVSADYQ